MVSEVSESVGTLSGGLFDVEIIDGVDPVYEVPVEEVEFKGVHFRKAYGKLYPEDTSDFEIELDQCAKLEVGRTDYDVEELKLHYKRAIASIDPQTIIGWHRWAEMMIDGFLGKNDIYVVWSSGGTTKSYIMARLHMVRWLVNWRQRCVMYLTGSLGQVHTRMWGYAKEFWEKVPERIREGFELKDSKSGGMGIYPKSETGLDHRHAFFVRDVKYEKSLGTGYNLFGTHPGELLMAAGDEFQEVRADFKEAPGFANMIMNKGKKLTFFGNPVNPPEMEELNALEYYGTPSEKDGGYKRIRQYKRVTARWKIEDRDTIVDHLCVLDGPKDDEEEQNKVVRDPETGELLPRLDFLVGKAEAMDVFAYQGERSRAASSQVFGWPHDRHVNAGRKVMLESVLAAQFDMYRLRDFKTSQWICGIDPARSSGGDNFTVTFARVGFLMDGRMGMCLQQGETTHVIDIPESLDPANIPEHLADRVIELVRTYQIAPQDLALEVYDPTNDILSFILNRKWGDGRIHFVRPSDKPRGVEVFNPMGNVRKVIKGNPDERAKEAKLQKNLFKSRIDENWYLFRSLCLSGQIGGLSKAIVDEMEARAMLKDGNYWTMEGKRVIKSRGQRSPDKTDSAVTAMDLAVGRFKMKLLTRQGKQWRENAKSWERTKKKKKKLTRRDVWINAPGSWY